MHSLYRAIGFSKIKSRLQMEGLYRDVMNSPTRKTTASIDLGTSIIQLDREFGDGIGITLIGEIDATSRISIEHAFPFATPSTLTYVHNLRIEKHLGNDSYDGIIDDFTLNIMFYLQNIADYVHLNWLNKTPLTETCMLSALSNNGSILLPLTRTKDEEIKVKKQHIDRIRLTEAARRGDEDALEDLALLSMDQKNDMYNKALRDGILSVVETTMMPYGIDCEAYEIIGIIERYKVIKNTVTDEEVICMTLQCNDYFLDVYINSMDLKGEPEVGRRFKGVIWMQGYVMF
ncbi:DUF3881 family protein [Eubacterium ruminantium]|uniref:DUF3881 family protein n=1 Tax=Eubacterium ruminantium TaxID=42322 RepID=UPI0023F07DA7|nr:DUF3881 family protein [Eubacterium ruminantium]